MHIHLQGIDPRVELSHYEELIQRKRERIGGAEVPSVLLLESKEDRKRYLLCQAAIKLYPSVHGSLGIATVTDMGEHITLVNEIAQAHPEIPMAELRTFHIDLLRSMQSELMVKTA